MSEVSSQCQGCYEKFTSLGNHIPRLLNCQHILCSECIERELYEDTFYCPFCFQELKGSIDEIAPIYLDVCDKEEEGQQQQQQQQQGEEQIGNNERNSIDNNGDKPRTSSLSLFTQENPNMSISLSPTSSLSIKSPDDRGSRVSDPFKFGECKEPNCQNKACASHGYCLNHSTRKKHSVLEESKIANALANTPLDFMSVEGNNLLLRESTHIWPEVVPSELIDRFRHQKRLEMGEAIDLINRAKIILSREPNILYLDAPVIAVGDIHGQFYDLLNILEVGGEVGKGDHYLFLGDYVDRGSFSCEVILTLLAFKVIYPDRVWLIRGNHECASVSGHFGFKEECKMKYGVQVYYSFLLLFQSLPLAAVIKTSFGQIFACHGGLSPTVETLEDLSKIYRFVEPEENSSLLDILWSDPINEEATDEMTDAEYEEFISIEWKPNPSRGCSYFYGFQAVNKFLEKNNLLCIIRAHEVQELGFHKHFDPSMISNRLNHSQKMKNSRRITSAILSPHRQFQPDALALPKSPMIEQSSTRKPFTLNHEDTLNFDSDPGSNDMFECEIDIPSVITVFSAPNYCDRYANKGAILKIDVDLYGFRVLQYDCVEHPKPEITESQMNNHILTVIAICPYMPTSFRDFVRLAIELGPEDNLIEDDEVYEVKISNEISTSTGITSENGEKNEVMTSIQVNNEINEQKSILTTPQKTVHVNTEKNQKNQNITIESTTPKCVLWQSIDDNDNDDDHNKAPTIESPEIKKMSQSDSLSSVEKENMFSPQEVRKRSSSMKKAGGSTEISVITRTGSHGFSFSAEDLPSASSPRSPEFSLSSTRNRSQSERGFGHHPLRRLSSGARLEGTAKAALELAKLDENIVSPIKDSLPPSSSFDTTNDSQKPARRSSAHGSYVSRYKTQVLRSSTYTQALASDAINELHPDQLARFMKNIQPGSFKLSDQEKPNISFSTLKERFEKKNTEANHYISVARQELMEYSQSIERGRVNSVSSLREKFDRKARENAERHHAETRKNKFRKRSASLEPSPLGEETKSPTEKSSKKDEPKEFRGRRSRRLSVESYFDVEKSTPIRAHSLSPVPPSTSSRIEKRTTQLPSSSSSLLSSSSSLIEDKFDVNNSPPRQRAMALIYKPERIDLNHNHNHDNSHNNTNTYHNSKSNQNISTNNNLNEKKSDNSPHKSTLHHHSTDKNNENIASSAPKVRTEYEFLMTYKPDNENKVHFTMRELLALRLLFSLFDRSGCAVIGYEDLVAYGEETGGLAGIRDAAAALEIVDIDGDGKIGLLDFIHFAARLQLLFQRNLMKRVLDELLMNATASNSI